MKFNGNTIRNSLLAILLIVLALYVLASPPTQGTPILNSTFGFNQSNENITLYNQSTAGATTNIIAWNKNNQPLYQIYLPFDTNYSNISEPNIIKDYSGNRHNGTRAVLSNQSPTWVTNCISGGCYNFNGKSNSLTFPPTNMSTFGDFTISVWIKPEPTSLIYTTILSQFSIAGNGVIPQGFALARGYTNPNTDLLFYINLNDYVEIPNNLTVSQWNHIAVRYNNSKSYIYINGTKKAQFNGGYNRTIENLTIGQFYPDYPDYWFNGSIDEIKIFNTSLSDQQIQALYKNETNKIVSSMLVKNDIWQGCITPNDGLEDGTTTCSNNLTVLSNILPTQSAPILNSTSNTNKTNENLTVYNQSTSDTDNESIKNIINWYKNGSSLTLLNMPFERNGNNITEITDYSGNGRNATSYLATYLSTGGYDQKGAYQFNGLNTYLQTQSISHTANKSFTISVWIYPKGGGNNYDGIITNNDVSEQGWTLLYGFPGNLNKVFFVTPTFGVGTAALSINKWYHIVAIENFETNNKLIYVNGILSQNMTTGIGTRSLNTSIVIGRYYVDSAGYAFNGTIDEVQIYNQSLRPEQVQALYLNRTDLIVQQETAKNEIWKACITPNDGIADGTTTCSGNLTILNSAPTIPQIQSPLNNTYVTNKTILWNASTDVDNDAVSYILYVSNGSNFNTINYSTNLTGLQHTFNLADGNWFAKVIANDGTDNSSDSGIINLTLDTTKPYINLTYANNAEILEGNFNLTYYVNDSIGISNCTLVFSSQANQTNLSISVNTIDQSFAFNKGSGTYTWQVYCSDLNNNVNVSETRALTLLVDQQSGVLAGQGGGTIFKMPNKTEITNKTALNLTQQNVTNLTIKQQISDLITTQFEKARDYGYYKKLALLVGGILSIIIIIVYIGMRNFGKYKSELLSKRQVGRL